MVLRSTVADQFAEAPLDNLPSLQIARLKTKLHLCRATDLRNQKKSPNNACYDFHI
jgi:hypothetical protein